jgi:Fe/S biogenesis protein NfuA
MATVTLKQGVERLIREAFPEVSEVIDITDHSMGSNPYYQATR